MKKFRIKGWMIGTLIGAIIGLSISFIPIIRGTFIEIIGNKLYNSIAEGGGGMVAFVAFTKNIMIICTVVGAIIGYLLGKNKKK